MSRRLKQFIYGFSFILILAFIGWGFYLSFFKTSPTCFDNVKNQNEEEIDCGGVCGDSCIPSDIKEIEVTQQKIFRLNSGRISLFAEVKNPNANFAAKNFKYIFNAYDANGQVVENITGDSFLYAGETGYILAPNLEVGSSSLSRPELIIDKIEWIKGDDFKNPKISVEDVSFSSDGNQIKISGSFNNKNIGKLNEVKIIAIFINRFGKPVGASETELIDVSSDAPQSFAIIHPFLTDIDLNTTRLFVSSKTE